MPPDNDVQEEINQLEQRWAENPQGLAFAHLADAFRRAGDFTKAEGLLLHGLKSHPNYVSGYNVLGRVYVESERFADAHAQFSKVLELDPQNLIALRALAELALKGGRREDARRWYERLLQVDPRNDEAREALEKMVGGPMEPPIEMPAVQPARPLESAPEREAMPAGGPAEGEQEVAPWESGLAAEEAEAGAPELDTFAESVQEMASGHEAAAFPAEETTAEEVTAGPAGAAMPWESLTDFESLEARHRGAAEEAAAGVGEPEVVPEEPAAEEALAGRAEGDGLPLELRGMEGWTPGFLRDEDLTRERGQQLGAGALMDDLGDDFTLDLGEVGAGDAGGGEAGEPQAGMVTETMAELYADQGLYEDALGVYRKLAESRPDDRRIRTRIADLEAQIEAARSEPVAGYELADLLELTEPRVPAEYGFYRGAAEAAEPEPEPSHEAEAEVEAAFHDLQAAAEEAGAGAGAGAAPPVEDWGEALEMALPTTEEPVTEEPGYFAAEPEVAAPLEGGFRFEDEAPTAGLEHLDPFAAAFDVLVKKDGQPARPAARVPEAPLPGFAGPVPVDVDGLPLVPPPEPEVLPPGADIAARVPAGEERAAAPAARVTPARRPARTIEEYLTSLLTYDPAAPKARARPSSIEERRAEAAPPARDSEGEDLAQFQEWLRSLKR